MTEWIVTASVLILVVTALRYLLRGRISLRLQYALWAIVLLRLLLPVQLGQTAFSVLNAVEENTELQLTVSRPLFYLGATPDMSMPVVKPSQSMNQEELTHLQQQLELQYYEDMARYATPVSPSTVLRTLWIIGIAVTSGWFLATNLRFARALRRSRRETGLVCGKLRVYVSPLVDTPCLFGLLRPAVYVTEDVLGDEAVLRHILAHEETHYRHGDHIWSVLRGVCLALHWYHPLVWLAAALSRRDAELACDEGALRRLGEEQRTAYGETLIALTCGHQKGELLLTATTMTGGKKSLRERIMLIAKRPKMALYTLIASILVIAVAAGCTFTGGKKSASPAELAFSYVSSAHVEAQVLSAVRTYITAHATILNDLADDDSFITGASIHSIRVSTSGTGTETALCPYDVVYYLECEDSARLRELREHGEFADKWLAEGTNGGAPEPNSFHTGFFHAQILAPYSSEGQTPAVDESQQTSQQQLEAALERLRGLQPEELETANVDSRFSAYTSAELAERIRSAADNLPDRAGSEDSFYWSLSVHLPATPKKNEGQEQITIRASVNEENLLQVSYRPKDKVTVTFLAEDSELYWFVRNAYRTEDTIDWAAMEPYRALLEAEAQAALSESAGWPQRASGYEILSFQQVDRFRQDGADYTVYQWDVAFLSDDPMMAGWAGGMWLDSQCRIRDYVCNTELCVRTVNRETDYILCGIYDSWASVDAQRETGRKSIVKLFAQQDLEDTHQRHLSADGFSVRYVNPVDYPDAVLNAAAEWIAARAQQINGLSGTTVLVDEGDILRLELIDTAAVSEFVHIRLYALDYRLRLRLPEEVNMQLDSMTYREDGEGLWLVEQDSADNPILVLAYYYNEERWVYAGALTETEIAAQYGGDYTVAAAEFYDSARSSAN